MHSIYDMFYWKTYIIYWKICCFCSIFSLV